MKPKVLIVDDDPVVRKFIRAGLGEDCEVIEASGGAQARSVFNEESPCFVFLDIGLPDIDGTELIPLFIEAKAVVVMLTAEEDLETARKALDLGASEYLTKPLGLPDLKKAVRRWLGTDQGRPYPWRRVG